MKSNTFVLLAFAGALGVCPLFAAKNAPRELGGVACTTPPPMHCPDANCGALVTEQGTAVEPKTGRKYFLDYPCDLKKNEKVTFILALHGGGSYGNWQRHYFPIVDYKDKYRLVIATPNAPPRVWAAIDDEYLQNIVNLVYEQVGKANIKQFWLVGHSQGGMTSNRLIRTDFFKQRVDGWLSLSGGRLGGSPGRGSFGNIARGPAPGAKEGDKGTPPAGRAGGLPGGASALTALREPPDASISFIYETGQHEMDDKGMPETSAWAAKYNCGARVKRPDVVDTKPGYVYDSTRQDPGSDGWGRLPRPGTAEIYEYPKCQGGKIVADVVRLNKGHTEGLEPHITEQLVKMMLSATLRSSQSADAGYRIEPHVVSATECDSLLAASANSEGRGRAGSRHLMSNPAVASLAADDRLLDLAAGLLGGNAIPFRATLFEKTEQANWLIAWHQDTALPFVAPFDRAGWGPWSVKSGVHYAHAPSSALERIVALRVQLDDSTSENGPLRVIRIRIGTAS